ncbi:MAG: OmpA family protein [Pseudomonadota bacterium]
MKLSKIAVALSAIGCILLASQPALAQETTFVNPEWANSAWYIGAGIGQSRASVDEKRLRSALSANGETVSAFKTDERDVGYKLFIGKQINQYFAVEAAYTDLGKFGFNSATAQGGVLNGTADFRSVNLDLVGTLPLSQRFAVLARLGMNYTKTNTKFSGNRLAAVTNKNPTDSAANASFGLGLEYKFSEAVAMRGEATRHRVNDAVGNRGDVDMYSLSLVYKLGRPAARAYVAPAPVVVAPAPVVEPAPMPAPAPAPVPVSEKVSFAAEALFDFDKSIVKPEGKAALDDLLNKLQGMNTEVMVTVGHTDSIGSDEYNQRLSLRRAEAVKAYIVSKGVDGARVYTEGKGESQPVADNKTAEGRAKNRRVTVEVVGTRTVTR